MQLNLGTVNNLLKRLIRMTDSLVSESLRNRYNRFRCALPGPWMGMCDEVCFTLSLIRKAFACAIHVSGHVAASTKSRNSSAVWISGRVNRVPAVFRVCRPTALFYNHRVHEHCGTNSWVFIFFCSGVVKVRHVTGPSSYQSAIAVQIWERATKLISMFFFFHESCYKTIFLWVNV